MSQPQVRLRLWTTFKESERGGGVVSFQGHVLSAVPQEDGTQLLERRDFSAGFKVNPFEPVVSTVELSSAIQQVFSFIGRTIAQEVGRPMALQVTDRDLKAFADLAGEDQVLNAQAEMPFVVSR